MRLLPFKEDPTGFLNLFRGAAADRFGDPSGFLRGRGRWPHHTKSGPGRRRAGPWHDCAGGATGLRTNHGLRRGR